MHRLLWGISIVVIGILFCAQSVYAFDVVVSTSQTALQHDEELVLNVQLNGSVSNGTRYYLRGIFYQQSRSASCGFTWNGSSWYNGSPSSQCTTYPFVEMQNGSASAVLRLKFDPTVSACSTSGTYLVDIQRLTTSCSSNYESNTLSFAITVAPTPTPIPTSTPIPSPTSTPTPVSTPTVPPTPTSKPTATPLPPTSTMTPTLAPATRTPAPQSKTSPTATIKITDPAVTDRATEAGVALNQQPASTDVLAAQTEEAISETDTGEPFWIWIIAGSGILLFALACAMIIYQKQWQTHQ